MRKDDMINDDIVIEVKDLIVAYEESPVLWDINLNIKKGILMAIVGPNGAGKSTLIKAMLGLVRCLNGEVKFFGREYKKVRNKIAYVPQRGSVDWDFPTTVFDVVEMGTYGKVGWIKRVRKEDKLKVKEAIKKVDLEEFENRQISRLSGGQQQRIGVIRALSANQDIILMDEPFGALDPITRENLQILVKNLQMELGKTFIFVTHDIDEAFTLADKIAIMDAGQLIQYDTPDNILKSPANDFVKNLLGEKRLDSAKFDYLPVEEVMIRNPKFIHQDKTTREAMEMMHKSRVDTLFLVDDDNVLTGLVDVFDIRSSRDKDAQISSYMMPVQSLNRKTPLKDAIFYINNLGYRNMPVVDEDLHLIGVVTRASVMDIIYSGFLGDYKPTSTTVEV
mgnify:CR=1 FL=1